MQMDFYPKMNSWQRMMMMEMDNFKELKKWRTSADGEKEEGSSSSSASFPVIRVLPKDVEESGECTKRVVVITPDDSASTVVDYLGLRYPEVAEWTVECRGESKVMVETSVKQKKPWWKRLFFCCVK
ncbi:uncharacterized protein LOC111614307 [Centruroides sculpturatus]|uniref:uncharacterized protein LOC111614307 n=1 Tax=Centruroides sculpturatus TaxID=218467 RepID=UPI000C6CD258|nr:uncharacterized protein LOC111614307 [Centruroides sculpturatus]